MTASTLYASFKGPKGWGFHNFDQVTVYLVQQMWPLGRFYCIWFHKEPRSMSVFYLLFVLWQHLKTPAETAAPLCQQAGCTVQSLSLCPKSLSFQETKPAKCQRGQRREHSSSVTESRRQTRSLDSQSYTLSYECYCFSYPFALTC